MSSPDISSGSDKLNVSNVSVCSGCARKHSTPANCENVKVVLEELTMAQVVSLCGGWRCDQRRPLHLLCPTCGHRTYNHHTYLYYRVKVTVDSSDNSETDKVRDSLAGKMKDVLIAFDENPLENVVKKFDTFLAAQQTENPEFAKLLEESCSAIDETFHKYKLENCAISFNGGKDCTALLHLVHVCFVRKYGSCEGRLPQLQAIYIEQVDSFSEQDSFIHDTVQRYNLRLLSVDGRTRNMQKTLFALCEQHPQLQTVFLGGRRNDPGLSAARVHQATDEGWPALMRVQPLLDWKYKHIWTLLRKLYLPYCSLYDLGYTSIGSKKNTVKNAALLKVDGFGLKQYSPAYCLVEEETERSGRVFNKK